MERRPFDSSESEDEEQSSEPEQRRIPAFYAMLERIGLAEQHEAHDDDEEDDDDDTPKGRFRRMFGSIFGKVAKKEEVPEQSAHDTEEQQSNILSLPFFNIEETAPTKEQPSHIEPESPEPSETPSEIESTVVTPERTSTETPEERFEEFFEDTDTEELVTAPEVPPLERYEAPIEATVEPEDARRTPDFIETERHEHREATPTTEKETVVERSGSGPALAALAAAELLSRSRDKKLRDQAEKTQERVRELEKEAEEQKGINERQRQRFNSVAERSEPRPVLPIEKAAEKPEQPSHVNETPELRLPVEKQSRREAQDRSPVMSQPERAIQTELPPETMEYYREQEYQPIVESTAQERQHEVKEEPSAKPLFSVATTARPAVKDKTTVTSTSTYHAHHSHPSVPSTLTTSQHHRKTAKDDMYQQAIKAGVGVGALIITIALTLVALGVL